jgi:hypothetical protein
MPRQPREEGGGEAAARRAGFEQPHRRRPRRGRGHQPAGRVHQPERAPEAPCRKRRLEPRDIAFDHRLHVGVRRHGHRARVLAHLRRNLAGQRQGERGMRLGGDPGNEPFVHGIGVGMQQADRHRLHSLGHERVEKRAHLRFVKRGHHAPGRIDPFVHLAAQVAGHERLGEPQEQVVDVVALFGPGLEHVAEPAGRDQCGPRPAPLDDRVRDERRAVDDFRNLGQRHACRAGQGVEPVNRRIGRVGIGGERLVRRHHPAGRVRHHEVGEGAADVEADAAPGRLIRPFKHHVWPTSRISCRTLQSVHIQDFCSQQEIRRDNSN